MSANTDSQPLIEVLIPAHNAGKTIKRAIDSVANQTFLKGKGNKKNLINIHVILSGCTDNTAELVSYEVSRGLCAPMMIETPWSGPMNTIPKVIPCVAPKGVVAARNQGIARIVGRANPEIPYYIAMLDADDYWHPTKLEKQLAFLEANPDIDILGTQLRLVSPDGALLGKSSYPTSHDSMVATIAVGVNPIGNPSAMIRPRVLEKTGSYEDLFPVAEDFWFWCKAAKCGYKMANLDEELVDYTSTHNPNYNALSPKLAAHCFNLINNNFGNNKK